MSRHWITQAVLCFLISSNAHAISTLPFDPSQFPDPNALLTKEITNAIVKTAGLAADHRSYEPATALGTKLGVDIGIEITGTKLSQEFKDALALAGLKNYTLHVIPIPKIHLHKGISSRVGLNLSLVYYQGYRIYGGDVKVTVLQPEEGPTLAFRVGYNFSKMGFVDTRTITPQLVISRALFFADPYIGVGYQITSGKVTIPVYINDIHIATLSNSAKAQAFLAFTGIQFRVPGLGLQLTLEGAYSSAKIHTLGTKVGFSF